MNTILNAEQQKELAENNRELGKLKAALNELRKIDAEMPLQAAIVLIEVMLEKRITQRDLAASTNMHAASVSRNVASLASHGRGQKVAKVISQKEDTQDRRVKILELTAKGHSVASSLVEILKD